MSKERVCIKCYKELEPNQLFCQECGEPTQVLVEELSAKRNWQETWGDFKNRKGENYPFAIFYVFALLLPLFLVTTFLLDSYFLTNMFLLIYLPLLFIPLAIPIMEERRAVTIRSYFGNLKHYPRLFLFVLINLVYFFLLKVITTSVDPILNIVRLIMVLYWLAIVVPYPHLLLRKDVNPFKGLKLVYIAGKETRWQQFFICVYLFFVNLLGLAMLGIGLLVTIPYSFAVIEKYYLQMAKLDLFALPGKERSTVETH
jgi:hypothetical protein